MHQSYWYRYICFSANVYRYHSNNSYGEVRFDIFSHSSSNFTVPLLLLFTSNFEVVSQNYAL